MSYIYLYDGSECVNKFILKTIHNAIYSDVLIDNLLYITINEQ